MKWVIISLCLNAALGGPASAGRYEHRTRDLIRPSRDLVRPDRIVGGEPVNPGDMPWQVSIQLHESHFCGGTLIEDSWVITAAHCTRGINYKNVVVVTGAYDLHEPNTAYKVTKLFTAGYNAETLQHDIALLKLNVKKPVKVVTRANQKAFPVAIESRTEKNAGYNCTISGWGKLKSGGMSLPSLLMAADVQVMSDAECTDVFSSGVYRVFDTNLCAGGRNRDACQGDSGGPLVCCENSSDNRSCRLTGVVSWGIGCATPGIPGVYTEVAHYNEWIKSIIEKEDGNKAVQNIRFFV